MTRAVGAEGAAWALRQVRQWQMPLATGSPLTRYRTAPHLQAFTFWDEPEQGIGILIVFAAMHHLYKLTVKLS